MDVILNTGQSMPMLGLGTFQLYSPDVITITEAALKQGYKLIDTAEVYRNEAYIGQVLTKVANAVQRKDIFITSKLGPNNQGAEKANICVQKSLECLQLNYLDLYLIHWPGVAKTRPDSSDNARLRKESWLQLETLLKEGKLRAIGVSNYTLQHMKELLQYCSIKPAVLQIEAHPYLTQRDLREFCNEHEIHVQAYSSLGSKDGCKELFTDPIMMNIAAKHNKTCAQVLLRWAIEHGMSVIPKTSNFQHLKENMAIFDFTLSAEEIQQIDNANKDKHYCWNAENIK